MESIKKIYKYEFPETCHYSDKEIIKLHDRSQLTRSPDGTYNKSEYDKYGNFIGNSILDQTYYPFQRKPSGLWYATKDSWMNRISFEAEPYYPYEGYLYETIIKNKINIYQQCDINSVLVLRNLLELVAFYETYKQKYNDLHYSFKQYINGNHQRYSQIARGSINWINVAKDYGGIEIPYPRFKGYDYLEHSNWFHNWDVASGCVWNVSCVNIRLL